jgi:hypothetical protein
MERWRDGEMEILEMEATEKGTDVAPTGPMRTQWLHTNTRSLERSWATPTVSKLA